MIVDESSSGRARRKWPRKTNAPGHQGGSVGPWVIIGCGSLIVGVVCPRNVIFRSHRRRWTDRWRTNLSSFAETCPAETKVWL